MPGVLIDWQGSPVAGGSDQLGVGGGNSLLVQWFTLHAFTAVGMGSIPELENYVPEAL